MFLTLLVPAPSFGSVRAVLGADVGEDPIEVRVVDFSVILFNAEEECTIGALDDRITLAAGISPSPSDSIICSRRSNALCGNRGCWVPCLPEYCCSSSGDGIDIILNTTSSVNPSVFAIFVN